MKLSVCVDDTDDRTKITSTGKIADRVAEEAVGMGASLIMGVTRHQLLLHPDINYTSHNSAMCMELDIGHLSVEDVEETAANILRANAVDSSNPGLCVCILDKLKEPDILMTYGRKAQKKVITMEEAFDLSEKVGGVHLKRFGDTGMGVIGALAGVGLRLTGCDGTFRGGKDSKYDGRTETTLYWKKELNAGQVLTVDGCPVPDDEPVTIKNQLKLAYLNHMRTVIVKEENGRYFACKKDDLYDGDRKISRWNTSCELFKEDNDVEECYDIGNACYNCLYRMWTSVGMKCVKRETST